VSQPSNRHDPPSGPVDCVVLSFPGSKFKGDIVPAIARLVDAGIVRILDLVFVQKSENGDVVVLELSDLGGLAELVEPGDAAALLVWENVWAAEVTAAIRAADGEVVLHERIPSDQVEAAWASAVSTASE
jgi:hypothetical protein